MYKLLLKPLFFLLPPEKAHYLAMDMLQATMKWPVIGWLLRKVFTPKYNGQPIDIAGLHFPHPVGLAAGFDKDARWTDTLASLGFSFIEIGTVTPKPQPGNEQPRLFRLPEDQALINRMGFNNEGSAAAATRLSRRKSSVIIGGNIGKNKTTPNDSALEDYLAAFTDLYNVVDYFAVNVSSPNTPGLRELQDKEPLKALLQRLQEKNKAGARPKPIFLKIAPDLTREQLDDIVEIVKDTGIAGVIATNTTIERKGLAASASELQAIGTGGLSGAPVRSKSTEVVRYLHGRSDGVFPIIAAGGVHTAADAREKLDAGASLVQVYTGFVYEGPGIVKKICQGLSQHHTV
jgi:dihydroorotate dehydrogenase